MSTSAPTLPTDFDALAPFLSYSPVVLSVHGRPVDLHLRVSAPATGIDLPVILLSHGHGHSNHLSSLNGYAPLANLWAAAGFVVVQPTPSAPGPSATGSPTPPAPRCSGARRPKT